MKTLEKFVENHGSIPASTVWYLTFLAEAKGKQQLFLKQIPQRLKALREHAVIESAVSSNRIEGVNIAPERIRPFILGKAHIRDRDEEEVHGYQKALKSIHKQGHKLKISEETICKLHRTARGQIWDAGKYKEIDGDIIERYPDGRTRVRFKTVKADKTPDFMDGLTRLWNKCLSEQRISPLIALAGFNLDFLCIYPFRDGNGRVSRLVLLLQLYHLGFEVGRYISTERLIEENKERYYETLEESSVDWHQGRHDPWPFINYVLFILKRAYLEFEDRLGQTKSPRGAKTELVNNVIQKIEKKFSVSDIEYACPEVSRDLIRRVLRQLQKDGKIKCLGRGPGALWTKRG